MMRRAIGIFFLLGLSALAQTPARFSVAGRVENAQRQGVAGVRIELSKGLLHIRGVSDASGHFELQATAGKWRLQATRSGAPPLVAGPLTLQPGESMIIVWDEHGGQVRIVAPASTAAAQAAAAGGESVQVKTLPLRGQASDQLATLVPGTGSAGGGGFSVDGNRSAYNTYLVSGVNDLDPYRGSEGIGQGGAFGAPAVLIPLGAVEGMQIITNAGAQYIPSGGVLLTTILSGTAQMHGSLFEYFDNDRLVANNFYNNVYRRPRQIFRNNQFGFTLGGPVPGVGGHAFIAVEAQREQVGVTYASRLPSPQDIATASNLVTQSGRNINPLGLAILNQYPAALGSGPLSFSVLGLNHGNTMTLKVDHRLSATSKITATYVIGDNTQAFPQGSLGEGGGSRLPAYSSLSPTRVQLLSVQAERTGGGAWSEQARGGYSRFLESTQPTDGGFDPTSIGLVTGASASDGGLPEIDIAPGYYENLGASLSMPRGRVSDVYDYTAMARWTSPVQQWSFGTELMAVQENAYSDNGFRGHLVFNGSQLGNSLTSSLGVASLTDLLAGLPAPGVTAIARGNSQRYVRQKRVGEFVHDQWRVSSRLQLTLGLRYDLFTVPTETQNLLSNFLPSLGLVPVGPGGMASLYNPNHWDFAPRASAEWNWGGGRVWTAAWGLYHDPASLDQIMEDNNPNSVLGGPFFNPLGKSAIYSVTPAAPVPFGLGIPIFGSAAPQPPFDVFGVAQKFPDPRFQVYHLALEQQLGRGNSLTVGYYGSKGTHLPVVLDVNQPTPGPTGAAAEQARRPFASIYPDFRVINMVEAAAISNYNSLQIAARITGFPGLSLQAAYTWSKSLDDSSSSGLTEDSRDLMRNYGPSNFDQRQHLSLTYAYQLPVPAKLIRRVTSASMRGLLGGGLSGWQLNGITTFAGGSPFTVVLPYDNSGTGEFLDRPNLVGNPHEPFNPTGPYLNPAAFAVPEAGTYGNLARNTFYGPGLNNFDLSLVKSTPISGGRTLRLRAEFFNAFNHPNFAMPSSTYGSGFLLTSTPDVSNPYFGAGGPRNVQLVAEFLF